MAEQDAVRLHLTLMRRIIACQEFGLRVKRLRVTPEQLRTLLSAYQQDYGIPPQYGYRFSGYPIVTNWER